MNIVKIIFLESVFEKAFISLYRYNCTVRYQSTYINTTVVRIFISLLFTFSVSKNPFRTYLYWKLRMFNISQFIRGTFYETNPKSVDTKPQTYVRIHVMHVSRLCALSQMEKFENNLLTNDILSSNSFFLSLQLDSFFHLDYVTI